MFYSSKGSGVWKNIQIVTILFDVGAYKKINNGIIAVDEIITESWLTLINFQAFPLKALVS